MKREDLKALGIADENIDAIMKLHGVDIESHKATITTLTSERDTFKTQADEATKQINDFKGMDIEGVKKAAADWEAKAKQIETESAAQVAKVKFDYALEGELKNTYKVRDVVAIKAHLKPDAIQYDGEKFIGLKEQIEPLQKDKDFLFESDKPQPRIIAGASNQPVLGDKMTDAFRKGAGLPITQG